MLPDLREMVYCAAIRNADERVWQYFWTLYMDSEATDREELLNALGCSGDMGILSRCTYSTVITKLTDFLTETFLSWNRLFHVETS